MTTTDLELSAPANLPSVRDFDPAEVAALVESYPAFDPSIDIDDALEATLGEGATLRVSDLVRVKVPASEITDLMVPDPDRDGKLKPVDELIGIPVGTTSRRSYWASREVTGAAPDCYSPDLKIGVGMFGPGSEQNPTGQCKGCPMAVPGSANTGTKASACKEQRLVFLLSGDQLLPYILVVPPASLQAYKKFGFSLLNKRLVGFERGGLDPATNKPLRGGAGGWAQVEIGVGLEQSKNAAHQAYNALTFRVVRPLTLVEQTVVDAYSRFVEQMIVEQADALNTVTGDGDAPGMPAAAAGFDDEGFEDEGPEDNVEVPGKKGKSGR